MTQNQSETSRTDLIAAFNRVIARNGRRQATDLHVRRLLCYVRAKDVDGQGVQRNLRQLADRLVLTISTCRRVVARAVEQFGLLIVTEQRHYPGGQTANHYSINWDNVNAILAKERHEAALIKAPQRSSGSSVQSSVPNSTHHSHVRPASNISSSVSRSLPLIASSSPAKPHATTDQPPSHHASINSSSSSHLASLRFSSSSAVKPKTFSSASIPTSKRPFLKRHVSSRHNRFHNTSTSIIERLPPEITRIGLPSTDQVSASAPPTYSRATPTGCSLRSSAKLRV